MAAPDCCTPANLYPRPSLARLTRLLAEVTCGPDLPLDFALVDVVKSAGLESLYLQPNIVKHIGAISSLGRNISLDY